jgi:hypothetical protein
MDKFPLFSDLGGSVTKLLRHPREGDIWSAFNPSIGVSEVGEILCLFRSSNYWHGKDLSRLQIFTGNTVQNKTYIAKMDKDLRVGDLKKIEYRGFDFPITMGPEDAKLYRKSGRWELTAILKEDYGVPVPSVATFYLDGLSAVLIDIHKSPDPKAPEKNWMVPYGESNFKFLYGPDETYDGKVVKTVKLTTSPHIRELRGGSNLFPLNDGTYLGISHKTYKKILNIYDPMSFGYKDVMVRNYTHVLIRVSKDGEIIQVSEEFQFYGRGIEFAAGLIVIDDEVIVSFGHKDLAACFGRIELSKFMEALHDC